MWPFSKRRKAVVTPPVDLDTPVTNPGLVEAIDAFAMAQGPQQLDALLRELTRAVFLVAALMDKSRMQQSGQAGQVTIQAGSQIGVLEAVGPDGKRSLPLFTDWDAIAKYTNRPVSAVAMPAHQAWGFATEKYDAAIVNPGGPALPLDRDQVVELARMTKPPV
jgi:SseB protein N-terminal domain